MKWLVIAVLSVCAGIAQAQTSFPTSLSVIYQPKTRDTLAVVEQAVGHIQNVQLGSKVFSPTAFLYVGADTQNQAGAAGFGLRLDKSAGPSVSYHVGAAYGVLKGQNPHFGLEVGIAVTIS